jgi:hypothetical protein
MNGNTMTKAPSSQRRSASGPKKKPVLVDCERFRCVAYQDAAGTWRAYFSGVALHGKITVVQT